MNVKECRDCGYVLEPNARGCSQCALNLEAESMIDRFVRRRIVPAIIVAAILAVAILLYWVR